VRQAHAPPAAVGCCGEGARGVQGRCSGAGCEGTGRSSGTGGGGGWRGSWATPTPPAQAARAGTRQLRPCSCRCRCAAPTHTLPAARGSSRGAPPAQPACGAAQLAGGGCQQRAAVVAWTVCAAVLLAGAARQQAVVRQRRRLTHCCALHDVNHHHALQASDGLGGCRPHRQRAPHAVAHKQCGHTRVTAATAAAKQLLPHSHNVLCHGLHGCKQQTHAHTHTHTQALSARELLARCLAASQGAHTCIGCCSPLRTGLRRWRSWWRRGRAGPAPPRGTCSSTQPTSAHVTALATRGAGGTRQSSEAHAAAASALGTHCCLSCCATSDHVRPV
jgi:hypothetical protein